MARLFVGETLQVETTVKDRDAELFDPDTLSISVIAPNGDETIHSTDDVVPTITNTSTGVYRSNFELDEVGVWIVTMTIEYEESGETLISREERKYQVHEPSS